MYLFSWIVDQIIYPFIKNYIHEPLDYLKFYLITVLTIFITTYLLSLIKKYFFKLLNYLKNIFKINKLIANKDNGWYNKKELTLNEYKKPKMLK